MDQKEWEAANEKGFAGLTTLSQADFWRALAAAPKPDRPHKRNHEIEKSKYAAPMNGIELTLALDYLIELGHIDKSTTIHYNSVNPDGTTVWTYRCAEEAEGQQRRCRELLSKRNSHDET